MGRGPQFCFEGHKKFLVQSIFLFAYELLVLFVFIPLLLRPMVILPLFFQLFFFEKDTQESVSYLIYIKENNEPSSRRQTQRGRASYSCPPVLVPPAAARCY
jgi:hypothetical protein